METIIRSVGKNIFKAELGRLPCTSKLAEMLVEARTVSLNFIYLFMLYSVIVIFFCWSVSSECKYCSVTSFIMFYFQILKK